MRTNILLLAASAASARSTAAKIQAHLDMARQIDGGPK